MLRKPNYSVRSTISAFLGQTRQYVVGMVSMKPIISAKIPGPEVRMSDADLAVGHFVDVCLLLVG